MNRLEQLDLLDRATAALTKRRERAVSKGAGHSKELRAIDEALAEVAKARDTISAQLGLRRGSVLTEIETIQQSHSTRLDRVGRRQHPVGR